MKRNRTSLLSKWESRKLFRDDGEQIILAQNRGTTFFLFLSLSPSISVFLTQSVSLFLSPSVCPFLSVSLSDYNYLSRYTATLQFWTYFWLAVSLFTISAIVFMSAHWQQTSVPLFVLSFFVWECPSASLVHYWGIGPLSLSANTRCLVMFQLLLSFTFPALISAHPSSCQWRPI